MVRYRTKILVPLIADTAAAARKHQILGVPDCGPICNSTTQYGHYHQVNDAVVYYEDADLGA